jgi:hypothetical protein
MIKAPPRDKDGIVKQHDHEEILDSSELIRRISHRQIITDANGNRVNSSIVFKASSNGSRGMSVDLKQLIDVAGIDAKVYVTSPRWMGSILLKVSDLRILGFQIGYNPLISPEPNPYHGEVWGEFSKGRNGTIEKIKSRAVWFVQIPNVSL